MVVPLFFIGTGIGFYVVLWLFQIPISTAKEHGWLFSFEIGGKSTQVERSVDLIDMFQMMDFGRVRWGLISDQLFTIVGIVFFSVIHVPVNT